MKYITIIFILTIFQTVAGQSIEEQYLAEKKIKVYWTADQKTFTEGYVDSIRYKVNDFVATKKIKETPDSIYYSLVHFDKSLVADRYQFDGTYCGNEKKIDLKEIRNQFPYNEMSSIKLVSFKQEHPHDDLKMPNTNGQVDFKKMFEIKTLDSELTNKILDILANYDNHSGMMEIAFCYEPRNGIVFVDKSGKTIGYIEICFACQQFKIEPETIKVGGFCNEKLDAIQGLFIKAGISYGMKRYEE